MLCVKICGINDETALKTAIDGGARYIGLVFYPPSPRAVHPIVAQKLTSYIPSSVGIVGLFVDPQDTFLEEVTSRIRFDLLQLHGNETVERVDDIRSRFSIPIMKAFRLAVATDLDAVSPYLGEVEQLLFDAKPSQEGLLPGGNGIPFDWKLLKGRRWPCPWLLSGGLRSDNLVAAVTQTGATRVDVSSGVEDRPGHKSPRRIEEFLQVAASL